MALTEDDGAVPTLLALSEDGPPSVSEERLNAYGKALWAVYDLREIWRNIGPRVARSSKKLRLDATMCAAAGAARNTRSAAGLESAADHRPSHTGCTRTKAQPSNHPVRKRVAGGLGQFFWDEVA